MEVELQLACIIFDRMHRKDGASVSPCLIIEHVLITRRFTTFRLHVEVEEPAGCAQIEISIPCLRTLKSTSARAWAHQNPQNTPLRQSFPHRLAGLLPTERRGRDFTNLTSARLTTATLLCHDRPSQPVAAEVSQTGRLVARSLYHHGRRSRPCCEAREVIAFLKSHTRRGC